jgi:hypothetical protein
VSAQTLPASRLLATALARAEAFLIEPAAPPAGEHEPRDHRPVVAVCGLAPRCGTTTVARGLAAALAEADPAGAAVVAGVGGATGVPHDRVATHASRTADAGGRADRPGAWAAGRGSRGAAPLAGPARRLGRALAQLDVEAGTRGRLCLAVTEEPEEFRATIRLLAPLLLEVPPGGRALEAARAADQVLIVTAPGTEPALALAAELALAGSGAPPLVVLNRGSGADVRWEDRAHVVLPDSRPGARAALMGRPAPGSLGAALGRVRDLVAAP